MNATGSILPANKSPKSGWLDFPDPVKAMALLGILLNHLVEEFGAGSWFTNPGAVWPSLRDRMAGIFPTGQAFPIDLVRFLGWLGDSCPGVFILLSGFGLTWSLVKRGNGFPALNKFYAQRILRIFPIYWAAHAILLLAAVFLAGSGLSLASRYTAISLTGIRFLPRLFFDINPSWWFVWLMVQLYAIFPFAYRLLQRLGPGKFMAVAGLLTLVARSAALFATQDRYFLLTGLFFGTRLAEFCAGMALAAYFHGRESLPTARSVWLPSFLAYALGFACSLTLPGSLLSNFLVTLGLCGLFYAAWGSLLAGIPKVNALLNWVGRHAYGIFLIHQVPLHWASSMVPWGTGMRLCAALAALLLSFPLAWALERGVALILDRRPWAKMEASPFRLVSMVALGMWLGLALPDPALWSQYPKPLSLLLGLGWAVLAIAEYARWKGPTPLTLAGTINPLEKIIRWAALVASPIQLWLLPPGHNQLAAWIGVVGALATLTLGASVGPGWERLWAWAGGQSDGHP